MKTSALAQLRVSTVIVLAAGHGGHDPGAVNGKFNERDQVITIVDRMAALLTAAGVSTVIAPHSGDTHETIPWINQRYQYNQAWVIEVHRDSADGLSMDDASRRCGVYTGTSSFSIAVGAFIKDSFIKHGAHPNSWNRTHKESPHKSLGFIRQTYPAAHMLELGFMEGDNTQAHLMWLAYLAATVLYEAFTGKILTKQPEITTLP